jgi:phosphomannomutase
VFVTGSGCQPSWTGLDFVGRHAQPLSREISAVPDAPGCSRDRAYNPTESGCNLDRLEARHRQSVSRPTRQGSTYRSFGASIPYEAGLWKHFHAIRPLKIACGCPSLIVRSMLSRLFSSLPCRLTWTDLPNRVRDTYNPDDDDVIRMRHAVRKTGADLGLLIDDDGCRTGFLDEEGRLIPAREITRLFGQLLLSEHPGALIAVESTALPSLEPVITGRGGRVIDGGSTQASVARALLENEAIFAGGDSGRYWFRESFPTTDAVLTFAKMLNLLSRSDARFSELVEWPETEATVAPQIAEANTADIG